MKLFVLLAFLTFCDAGRVLFYIPFSSQSIKITYMPVAEALAKRGHDVLIVSPFQPKKTTKGIREVTVDTGVLEFMSRVSDTQLKEDAPMPDIMEAINKAIDANEHALMLPEVQELFGKNEKVDVVFSVPVFGNEVGYFVAHKLGADLVLYLTAQSSLSWFDHAFGQPHNPAILDIPLIPFDKPMRFHQRIINTVVTWLFHYGLRDNYIFPRVDAILDKAFPGEDRPSLLELERNASLGISFGHPMLMDGLRPVAPNFIFVGMMNCRPGEPLPNDLKKFMDDAKEGVIFVSFGSVLQASQMSEQRRKLLLNVFGRLKTKVLWKWETEEMPDKPDNVLLKKWLPQQDILAHPNLKLFVTHGGQSSFQESLCHQKPVVVVPVAGDQPANGREAERIGFGLNVPFPELTEEKLYDAVDKVLNDPKYAETAKEFGSTIMDQIDRPLDRAVWWIEHVMRHPGMKHLRSPVHDLAWYQYFLIDVMAALIAIVVIVFYIIKSIVCCICCRSRKQKME